MKRLVVVGLMLAVPVGLALALVVMMFGSPVPHRSSSVCDPAAGSVRAVNVDKSAVPDTMVAGYGRDQLVTAAQIMAAGADRGLSARDQQIALATAMGESSLQSLNYGDAVGPDSRGPFQQRDSWGPLEQRLDPYQSAGLFYAQLEQVEGRDQMAPTEAAHRVQRNADPNYYSQFWAPAGQVMAALGGIDLSGMVEVASSSVSCTVMSTDDGAPAAGETSSDGWIAPADGPLTSGFGGRDNPTGSGAQNHWGVDLAPGCDAPIRAAADGSVTNAGPASGFGNWIVIDHGGGVQTVYGHMYDDGVLVRAGDQVKAGQQIGKIGSNGDSTGCHLHYETHVNGDKVDPEAFMDERGVRLG